MELQDLVGLHKLTGVDFENIKVKEHEFSSEEDAQVMRFRLDGKIYLVTEDPSDGYRSSMRDIKPSSGRMVNQFAPVKVLGRYRDKGDYGNTADILELIDLKTGRTVIEVGTDNSDDYYPSFVASFIPENMAINRGK